MIKDAKITVTWTHVIWNLNSEKIFYEKKIQKANQSLEFRKYDKNDNKLYMKWKDYANSLVSCSSFHDIFGLFDVLANILFTASEMMRD